MKISRSDILRGGFSLFLLAQASAVRADVKQDISRLQRVDRSFKGKLETEVLERKIEDASLLAQVKVNELNATELRSRLDSMQSVVSGAGPQGPTGPVGPEGAAGRDGRDGLVGPQGPVGPTGPTGPKGNDGAPGPTGAQGEVGPSGATGMDGAQGPIGPTGETGATGAQGVAGADGATGPTGPTGARGFDGAQGPIGPTGATGAQGVTGADGAAGATGATGAPGSDGEQGPIGPTGAAGAQGPQGPIGATGATGAQGVAGPTGPLGPQGPTGPQGPAFNTSSCRMLYHTYTIASGNYGFIGSEQCASDEFLFSHSYSTSAPDITYQSGSLKLDLEYTGVSIHEYLIVERATNQEPFMFQMKASMNAQVAKDYKGNIAVGTGFRYVSDGTATFTTKAWCCKH